MTLYGEGYTSYQLDRSRLRKLVRHFYLESAASKVCGPTVDFGCGVGELLRRLPPGSIGLEINPVSVEHCLKQGLTASVYDGDDDQWRLTTLAPEQGLQSLVISHVLEHLHQPMEKLAKLLAACQRLGISRVLAIVPGARGYASDDTHRTFVDLSMLSDATTTAGTGFRLDSHRYFPGNVRILGQVFPHHELQVVYRTSSHEAHGTDASRRGNVTMRQPPPAQVGLNHER